tara:strand:- start:374 stop:1009 length:636 start_codon:yes stop_codon:yes gene_type:complete
MAPTPSRGKPNPPVTRAQKHAATHEKLLAVAVQVLVDEGVARTTTLEVQKRADVSRGALLHHFPTHAELLSATVDRLVQMNEAAVWEEATALSDMSDPVERTIRTLANAFAHPSFAAELELWAVARTDEALWKSLRVAERRARESRDRVVQELFAPLVAKPRMTLVAELSTEFIRGLTQSNILRKDTTKRDKLIRDWIGVAQGMLEPPESD